MFTHIVMSLKNSSDLKIVFKKLENQNNHTTYGAKYSRVDQVKFVEDSLKKFYLVHS